MSTISLKYGRSSVSLDFDEDRFDVLHCALGAPPLTDVEIGSKLDDPVGSPRLEDLILAGDTVLIVVPDATRQTACGEVVNLLVRRLIANGTVAGDIRIVFATGIHRRVTEDEKLGLLSSFIVNRIRILDHDPRDLAQLVRFDETHHLIPVELNRALVEHDKVIIVGGIAFHYFAGFTGGRKLICPGLASARTIAATHKLAFDCEKMGRRNGVGTGLLAGNAVHEAFENIVKKIPPTFAINTIVDDDGHLIDLFCGDWIASHQAACESYGLTRTLIIPEKRDVVVVSCGGYPYDINMIQAHKALDAGAQACNPGGTILFMAECSEGMGRSDFMSWFDAADSESLAKKLCERYQVNGQTAWSLLKKTEEFDVRIISGLDSKDLERLRIKRVDSLQPLMDAAAGDTTGYIIPNGARVNVRIA